MNRGFHALGLTALLLALVVEGFFVPSMADVVIPQDGIRLVQLSASEVLVEATFLNDGAMMSEAGEVNFWSQEFGAFVPRYDLLGTEALPALQPGEQVTLGVVGMVGMGLQGMFPPPPPDTTHCPPDSNFAGNVDIEWFYGANVGQANYHVGWLNLCPGFASLIHLITNCPGNATWVVNNPNNCPYTIALLNEDMTAAPANLPPGWTGWIQVRAALGTPVGSTCCFSITFTCMGVNATVNVCGIICICDPTGAESSSWGTIKSLFR